MAGSGPFRRPHRAPLASHPAPNHPTKREPAQLRLIPDFLSHGAEASGFRGAVWTCARVAQVIPAEFGVSYHQGHVSRLLKELHGTPPLPIARAIQRDEQEIEEWRVAVWPRLQEAARRQHRALVCVAESGFYLRPGKVRIYAPEGHTPVLPEWPRRDPLSVRGGVTPVGKISTLVRQEPLNGRHTSEFLKHWIRHVESRLLVIWDGSPLPRRAAVNAFLDSAWGRGVRVERLPPDAPDLNPVEGAWPPLKHVAMHNLVCLDLEELHLELHLAIGRLRHKPRLIQSVFEGAGLELEKLAHGANPVEWAISSSGRGDFRRPEE